MQKVSVIFCYIDKVEGGFHSKVHTSNPVQVIMHGNKKNLKGTDDGV
jgi:hypothetical protein